MRDAHEYGLVSRYGYLRLRSAMLMLYNLYIYIYIYIIWPCLAISCLLRNSSCKPSLFTAVRTISSSSPQHVNEQTGNRIPHDSLSSLHQVRFDPFCMEQSCHHMIHKDFFVIFYLYICSYQIDSETEGFGPRHASVQSNGSRLRLFH